MRLSIAQRLLLLALVFVVGLLGYGAWSLKTLNELQVNGPLYQRIVQGKDLVADILPPPEYIIESYLVSLQLQAEPPADRAALIQRLGALRKDYDSRHAFWQDQPLEPELRSALLERAHQPAQAFYQEAFSHFIPALQQSDAAGAQAALTRMQALYASHRQAIDQVVEMANRRNAADEANARERVRAGLVGMLSILVLVTLLGALISWAIIRHVRRSLSVAGSAVAAMAQGDLSQPLACDNSDEIGRLVGQLGQMQQGLRSLVAGVHGNVSQLNTMASQLTCAATGSAELGHQQTDAATGMAAGVQQLSVSIDQISDHAREASTVRQAADAHLQTSVRSIDDTVREIRQLAQVVNGSAATVGELEGQSQQISDILARIQGIAEQTNLLALNAAIEAARAGEQGRGFAVVADEVRKLAEHTALSTQEIDTMMDRIQQGMQRAVQEMAASVDRVGEAVALANRAGESIGALRDSASQVNQAVAGISDAIHGQAEAAREISGRVEQVASLAEQASGRVSETAALSEQLAWLASALEQQAGRFRL
jgi:methyl-accepting chemotaxis protein